MNIDTPYGSLRTTTKRRFVLVGRTSDGEPFAFGYTDSPATARLRANAVRAIAYGVVVVDKGQS